jgi:hypothetical protein
MQAGGHPFGAASTRRCWNDCLSSRGGPPTRPKPPPGVANPASTGLQARLWWAGPFGISFKVLRRPALEEDIVPPRVRVPKRLAITSRKQPRSVTRLIRAAPSLDGSFGRRH